MSLYNHDFSPYAIIILAASAYVASVYSYPGESINHRNFIFCRYIQEYPQYMHMKIFSRYDIDFSSNSHFAQILKVALLSISLSLET